MIKFYKPKYFHYGTFRQWRFLNTSKFTVSINRIGSADSITSCPHDHGCDFYSIVLKGRYSEKLYKDFLNNPNDMERRTFKIFSGHKFLHNWAHSIYKCDKTTYTLFITFNHLRRKSWIYTPEGTFTQGEFYLKGLNKKYGEQDPIV